MQGVDASSPSWVRDVLGFWFDELSPSDWFQPPPEVDAAIAARFSQLPDDIVGMDEDTLLAGPRIALAAILVLDQFPRNLHRNTARAFAYDDVALRLAQGAVARGVDRDSGLNNDQRLFLYLPFEHSEDASDQQRAVELISVLGNDLYTRFAEAHRDIIVRFGRFPHRNKILGRATTGQEAAFLLQPESSF